MSRAGAGSQPASESEEPALDPVRRSQALRVVRRWPDSVLKLQAKPVQLIDDDLLALIAAMRQITRDTGGLGLAAPQIGITQRFFVFDNDGRLDALINPQLIENGAQRDVQVEGCLSLPGVVLLVERPTTVTFAGVNERGEDVRYELEGLAARVAQHEYDHLEGTLILDRASLELRSKALRILRDGSDDARMVALADGVTVLERLTFGQR